MTATPSSGSRTYCFIRNSNDDNDGNTFPPFYHSIQIVCELQFIDLLEGFCPKGSCKVDLLYYSFSISKVIPIVNEL